MTLRFERPRRADGLAADAHSRASPDACSGAAVTLYVLSPTPAMPDLRNAGGLGAEAVNRALHVGHEYAFFPTDRSNVDRHTEQV